MKKNYKQKGFTIIEALIVAAIFGTVGLISADLLTRTFQGSNKVKLLTAIKQTGQSALGSLEQTIKYSEDVICPIDGSSSPTPFLVVVSSGVYTRFKIANNISGNYIAKDNPSPTNLDDTTLCDSSGAPPVPFSNSPTYLINQNTVSISSNSGFIVNNVNGGSKSVTIQFDLTPATTGTNFDTQATTTNFKTTVLLR